MLAWVCALPLTVAPPPDPDSTTHAVHPLPSEGTFLDSRKHFRTARLPLELFNFIHKRKVVLNLEIKPRNDVIAKFSSSLLLCPVWVLFGFDPY